jgi:ankyrin repeat protein
MAISRDDYEIVELLLKNGASLDVKDGDGNTILDYSRRYAGKKLMQFLLKDRTYRKIKVNK